MASRINPESEREFHRIPVDIGKFKRGWSTKPIKFVWVDGSLVEKAGKTYGLQIGEDHDGSFILSGSEIPKGYEDRLHIGSVAVRGLSPVIEICNDGSVLRDDTETLRNLATAVSGVFEEVDQARAELNDALQTSRD